jgi:hypothetical protein
MIARLCSPDFVLWPIFYKYCRHAVAIFYKYCRRAAANQENAAFLRFSIKNFMRLPSR